MTTHQTASISRVGPAIVAAQAGTPLRLLTVVQLYDAIEGWITERSVNGWQWSYSYRQYVKREIARYQGELRSRDLPGRVRDWQQEAEQEAADISDLHGTQACARA